MKGRIILAIIGLLGSSVILVHAQGPPQPEYRCPNYLFNDDIICPAVLTEYNFPKMEEVDQVTDAVQTAKVETTTGIDTDMKMLVSQGEPKIIYEN